MSMPEFPEAADLTRADAVNQIVSSIAMEELALSHIINAEGEKLQYVLGTIPGSTGPQPTIEQVLEVNESVRSVLQAAADNQTILRSKLQTALNSSVLYGPPGPQGPQGPATITVNPEVIELSPDESPYVLNNGTDQNVELQFAIPAGQRGEDGADGMAATIEVEPTVRVPYSAQAYVENIGTESAARFVFGIPEGTPGERGPEGPVGPQADVITTIPFSASKYGATLESDENGNPKSVAFSGFSPAYYMGTYLKEGEWEAGVIVPDGTSSIGALFIVPYDAKIKKIYTVFSTTSQALIQEGVIVKPFVCLAVSDHDSLAFNILQNTITFAEPYEEGEYPAFTTRRGALTDLDIDIEEGTIVAIIAGIMSEGTTESVMQMLAVHGGILLG